MAEEEVLQVPETPGHPSGEVTPGFGPAPGGITPPGSEQGLDGFPLEHSELLRSSVLWVPGSEIEYNYPIACFTIPGSGSDGDRKVSCILITDINSKLLVAVPAAAWHRSPAQRLLPVRALQKAQCLALASADLVGRALPLDGVFTKAWIGFLQPEMEGHISFNEEADDALQFWSEDGTLHVVPYAQALVEVAEDKFCFVSATSAVEGFSRPVTTANRLGSLETAVAGIQEGLVSLQSLLRESQKAKAVPLPPKVAAPKVSAARSSSSTQDAQIPGLDPSVVQAALKAGVQKSHLEEMSRLVQGKSGRLGDLPRRTPAKKVTPLGDSEEEEELVEDNAGLEEAAGPSDADPVASALVKLTSIVESLSASRKKNSLEDILEDPSGLDGGAHNLVTAGNQRRQAAVLKALQKSLLESPDQIYAKIEAMMLADFGSREAIPGEPTRFGSFRGWAEHRSRIPNIGPSVRIAWSIAGALDALRNQKVAEAQARLGLLLAAMDQVACDRGSWLLGTEVLLEPSGPPYSSFGRHVPPEFGENPHSRLLDSRWVDAMMFRVKELDDFAERKAKLGKRGKTSEDPPAQIEPNPKRKGAGKGKPNNKGNKSSGEKGAGSEDVPKE